MEAKVLLDSGSTTDMISPEFAQVAGLSPLALTEPMGLHLAVKGSRSRLNYGTWADINAGPVQERRYFDIVNIDRHDVILGTPFMWTHALALVFEGRGFVTQHGQKLNWPREPFRVRPARDLPLKDRQFFRGKQLPPRGTATRSTRSSNQIGKAADVSGCCSRNPKVLQHPHFAAGVSPYH
jgi:hypothetical protein